MKNVIEIKKNKKQQKEKMHELLTEKNKGNG